MRKLSARSFSEGARACFDFCRAHANHAQSGNFVECAALIGAKGGFQCGDGEFIDAQGAKEGVAADLLNELFLSRDDACLRAAEKFVPAEADDVRARSEARAHDWFTYACC